jgi:WD40 repeat protein
MSGERANPYVGPQAFERGQLFFGRNRERERLGDLIIAERIVLLYSPSGAGKTSLIQAALLPDLERQEFQALPVIRLYHQPPADSGRALPFNRYLYSMLLSLGGMNAQEASGLLQTGDLATSLSKIAGESSLPQRQLLIFDQFEELLTLDPTDEPDKREFLQQLARALGRRWALFAMREDYLAALDPYKALLPTQLRTTMRLEHLRRDQAEQAIRLPAVERGVMFTPEAVQKLVDDLSQTRVVQSDGQTVYQPGPYVEPVHLQVICRRLWDEVMRREPQRNVIERDDLGDYGNVDAALQAYYDDSVGVIAKEAQTAERAIREWLGDRLITREGLRIPAPQESVAATGLSGKVLDELIEARLVRSDQRHGVTWYELAHERLIDPIRSSNEAWFDRHLSRLERRAQLWERSGRPESLLLRDDELAEAERWDSDTTLGEREQEFLSASRRLEDSARLGRSRSLARTNALTAVVLFALLALTLISLRASDRQRQSEQVIRQAAIALSSVLEANPTAGLACAVSTVQGALNQGLPVPAKAEEVLRRAVGVQRLRASFTISDVVAVHDAVYTDQGAFVAVETQDDEGATRVAVWVWESPLDTAPWSPPRQLLASDATSPSVVALSSDGTRVAIVTDWFDDSSQGRPFSLIRVWNVQSQEEIQLIAASFRVTSVEFLPDGNTLSAAGEAGNTAGWQVVAWDLATHARRWSLADAPTSVVALAFSPDGALVAAGGSDGPIHLWELEHGRSDLLPSLRAQYSGEITYLNFDAEGIRLTAAGRDKTARSWEVGTVGPDGMLQVSGLVFAQPSPIAAAAYSTDGNQFATIDLLGHIRLWDAADAGELAYLTDSLAISMVEVRTWQLRFSPDNTGLLSVAGDGRLSIWDVAPEHEIWGQRLASMAFTRLAYNPEGDLLALGEVRGTIQLFHVNENGTVDRKELWRSDTPDFRVVQLAFSEGGASVTAVLDLSDIPNDAILGSGSRNSAIRRWLVNEPGEILFAKQTRMLSQTIAPELPVLLSPDGDYVLERQDNKLVLSASLSGAKELWEIPASELISAAAFDPTGAYLALGFSDGTVELWNVTEASVKPLDSFHASDTVTSLAVGQKANTTQLIVAGMADGSLALWDATGAPIRLAGGHTNAVTGLALRPDGQRLASTGDDGQVLLWTIGAEPSWWQRWPPWQSDEPAPAPVRLPTAELASHAIAFHPNATYFATADDHGELRVYALELRELLGIAEGAAGSRPLEC